MSEENYELVYEAKVITLGDSGVGKTNFIMRFIDDKFSFNYFSTYGIDVKFKNVYIKDGIQIKFKIFDTAGQERFKSISHNYIKKANGILLMYSIIDQDSYDNIEKWVKDIEENSEKKIPTILIATKCDLNDKRVIPKENGEQLAQKYGIKFYETSSKENINIEKAFLDLGGQIMEKSKGKKVLKNLELEDKKPKKKKECC